jgi:hypothetical protein
MKTSEIIDGLNDLIKDREALIDENDDGIFSHDKEVLKAAVEMLNKQSDEKGLTVKLPCKLGDKVYYIEYHAKNPIKSGTVWQYGIGEDGIWCSISVSKSKALPQRPQK